MEKTQRWMNVKDSLPNDKQFVLFRLDNGKVLSGIFYALNEMYVKNVFNDTYADYSLDWVTHWMPIPPYPSNQ